MSDFARRPLYVVLNATAGRDDVDATERTIAAVLADAGRPYEIARIEEGTPLEDVLRRAKERARDGHIVVAAGATAR